MAAASAEPFENAISPQIPHMAVRLASLSGWFASLNPQG
jgi:hypothetical protein